MLQIKNPVLPDLMQIHPLSVWMIHITLRTLRLSGFRSSSARVKRFSTLESSSIRIVHDDIA